MMLRSPRFLPLAGSVVLAALSPLGCGTDPPRGPGVDGGGGHPSSSSGGGFHGGAGGPGTGGASVVGAGGASDGGPSQGDASEGGTHALAFVPWVLIDAEKGTLGAKYEGSASDQWSSADGDTLVDQTYVFEGNKSFKMHAAQGTPNNGGEYGTWGAIKDLPTSLHKGDILHAQLAVYFPADFDWTANPWLKFFRLHTADGTTAANHGYDDFYIYNQLETPGQDGQLNNIYEGFAKNAWMSSTATLTKGQWNVIESETTFDDVSVDDGGTGRTRLWYANGTEWVLALDRTNSNTLSTATDVVDGFYVFTYWNSGSEDGKYPTKAQDCWVDRVVLENDLTKLVETDSDGNKIIGGL
jgi:hypothetical protein